MIQNRNWSWQDEGDNEQPKWLPKRDQVKSSDDATKIYRRIAGIPMGTNCAPLVADLFLFCYERDFMTSLSDVKQAEIIEAFKPTSRYLDDLF